MRIIITLAAIIWLTGCSIMDAYVSPVNSIILSKKANEKNNIKILMLNQSLPTPYTRIGHVFLYEKVLSFDQTPLNDVTPLSKEKYREGFARIAKRIGADAVIGVNTIMYPSYTAGKFISGIAVKYGDDDNYRSSRDEFIACILPITSDSLTPEEQHDLDRKVRVIARVPLILQGYYPVTPLKTSFNGDLDSFKQMSPKQLDGLCGQKSDIFIVIAPKVNKNDMNEYLSIDTFIYSGKLKKFIVKTTENETPANLSQGLLGMFYSSLNANTNTIGKAFKKLPKIKIYEGDFGN